MNDYPKKLAVYLETLDPEQRAAREKLYRSTLAQAQEHHLQSPRFWAARQIIAGLNDHQIQHKIQKRIKRIPKSDPAPRTGQPARHTKSSPVRRLRETSSG